MNLTFAVQSLSKTIESILSFQDCSAFWSDSLYVFYPQLEPARTLPPSERADFLRDELAQIYQAKLPEMRAKVDAYAACWQTHRERITDAFSSAFNVDCAADWNDLRVLISLNPVSPRDLTSRCFEVFYLNSAQGALGVSLHELVHFVWFRVWQALFHDDPTSYEAPALPWIFSEMVVESVLRKTGLCELNPYFPREHGGCVYPYFFTMTIEDQPILETLDAMYTTRPINDFMRDGFAYCQAHEAAIREHIRRSECSVQ